MPWEVIILILGAAGSGRLASRVAGALAQHFGRSREDAERAVATGGISLVLRDEDEDEAHSEKEHAAVG
jgi:hypothetical protein